MADLFETIRDTLNKAQNGKAPTTDPLVPQVQMLLENQRCLCATLALLIRGGHVPIDMARDLQERAKKISKILEG